jgi:8-oxo-dGTP pyrophosphatase MutT (NUDIX family)
MGEIIRYTTAGGAVVRPGGELLALERAVMRGGREVNELRLPKGHIDPGETAEEAAVREVGEESGYWGVEIVADLGVVHSSFVYEDVQYERDERYFLMRLADVKRDAPQPVSDEEALFEPRWLSLAEAPDLLTYLTERSIAERAHDWVDSHGQP